MRLSGRLFLVLGLATGASVVTLFACGVDQEQHLPGLPDALPNNPGGAGFSASGADGGVGGGGGFGGAGGAGGGAIAGPAQSLCDVVAAANVAGSQCATCINTTAGGACATQASACTGDTTNTCTGAEAACAACTPGTTFDGCIVQCLDTSALYQQLVTCEFQNCNSLCGWSPPLACAITDGG